MKLVWRPNPGAAETGDPNDGEWVDDGIEDDATAHDKIDDALLEGSLAPTIMFGANSPGILLPLNQTRAPEFFGQEYEGSCGIAVVQNALKQLGTNVTSAQLMEMLSEDVRDFVRTPEGAMSQAQIAQLFNVAANSLGVRYQANIVNGKDRNDLAREATQSGNLFITGSRYAQGNHFELNIPTASSADRPGETSQVTVISSTIYGAVKYTQWGSDRGNALISIGDRPQSDPLYSIITITPIPPS